MAEIAIIGGGKWGQALYSAFAIGNEVCIASRRELKDLNQVPLEEALKKEYLILAIATQALRGWLEEKFVFNGQKILVVSKGIETATGKFLNGILEDFVPQDSVAFLSGPSFAAEVRKHLPTALIIHAHNTALAETFSTFFPEFIKTYTSTDVIGGEIAGAYKNVIAIAAGICDGLNLGNNAKAALVSRGLIEIARFGRFFGARDETFLDLSGAGDLFLTSSSTLSRNYRVGLGLAAGKSLDQVLDEIGETAEGVDTAKAIVKISNEKEVYTPIASQVAMILEGKDPKISLRDLLSQ